MKLSRHFLQSFIFILVITFVQNGTAAPATNAPSVFSKEQTSVNTSPIVSLIKSSNSLPILTPVPPTLNVHGYYLQDVSSGQVLATFNAEQRMAPASLTKLMTLYLTFEALQAGRVHLNDLVPVSENAWKTGGSRMFIKVGDRVPLSQLIDGVIVDSGNDACVALAEYIGGTEQNFVNLMNQQAQLLGMKNTHYMDCTGLPGPNHYTTPHDMAELTRALILNFPQYYFYFAGKTFTYNNITQPNRNRLLWSDPTVDGLKTGHTDEAGYCLIASAQRDGMRLISVLLGAPTDNDRVQYSEQLLNYGFHFFKQHKVYAANTTIQQVSVYLGKKNTLSVGVAHDFYLTVPAGEYAKVETNIQLNSPLKAPIAKGATVGEITATLNGKLLGKMPVIALENIAQANVFGRGWDYLRLWINKKRQ